MVRNRTPSAALLFLLPLALGSCNIAGAFFASTFPQDVTLMSLERDLSSDIGSRDGDLKSINLSVVSVNGSDYLFLTNYRQADETRLIVLDGDLHQLLLLKNEDLAGIGGYPSGSPAKLDTAGRILLGSLSFQPLSPGIQVLPPMQNIPQGDGFASPDGSRNFVDFMTTGTDLNYKACLDDWSFAGNYGPYAISSNPNSTTAYSIHGLFPDPDPARQYVVMVLFDNAGIVDHFLFIPMADFATGLLTPLLDNYERFSTPASDENFLGYSRGSVIRFVRGGGQNDGSFVRCDSSGVDDPEELHYFKEPRLARAFEAAGPYYFSFDHDTRIVKRMSIWW
jgi:hypothetical protein